MRSLGKLSQLVQWWVATAERRMMERLHGMRWDCPRSTFLLREREGFDAAMELDATQLCGGGQDERRAEDGSGTMADVVELPQDMHDMDARWAEKCSRCCNRNQRIFGKTVRLHSQGLL